MIRTVKWDSARWAVRLRKDVCGGPSTSRAQSSSACSVLPRESKRPTARISENVLRMAFQARIWAVCPFCSPQCPLLTGGCSYTMCCVTVQVRGLVASGTSLLSGDSCSKRLWDPVIYSLRMTLGSFSGQSGVPSGRPEFLASLMTENTFGFYGTGKHRTATCLASLDLPSHLGGLQIMLFPLSAGESQGWGG